MRVIPVLALGTLVAIALGGAAYAKSRDDDDQPPLPQPKEGGTCSTSADVNEATSEILADNSVGAQGLRNAADVLRNWTTYCDDAARETGKANIALLEAKAKLLEVGPGGEEPGTPAGMPPSAGSIWPVPPGYVDSNHTTGLHAEMGMVYVYPNGDMWFFPDNSMLIPYYIPGGSKDISTEGCDRCGRE